MTAESGKDEELAAEILELAEKLARTCVKKGLRLAAAEGSCAGLISASLTALPGSSRFFERGFAVYSNEAKIEQLQVDAVTIAEYGAVSAPTVKEMASGALRFSRADLAAAESGIVGPGGGSAAKPVGTVWIALCRRSAAPRAFACRFAGTRAQVRAQVVKAVLTALLACAEGRELLDCK